MNEFSTGGETVIGLYGFETGVSTLMIVDVFPLKVVFVVVKLLVEFEDLLVDMKLVPEAIVDSLTVLTFDSIPVFRLLFVDM